MSKQTKFPLSEIIGTESYFHQEINQRKSCSRKLSEYVTTFDYIDKISTVLSATSSEVLIILFSSAAGAPARVVSTSLTLIFSLATGILKRLLSITKNKNKKHEEILILAKVKLDSVEILVSQALTDMEISHEEFDAIIREKQKYEKMNENVKNVGEKQENMRLNSVNSKKRVSF